MFEFKLKTRVGLPNNEISIYVSIDNKDNIHYTDVRLNAKNKLDENSLRKHGFTEEEINGLINLAKYDSANPVINQYDISDEYNMLHKDAVKKFNDIIYKNKPNNLSEVEQYLLKRFGKTEYRCVIDKITDIDESFMYMFAPIYVYGSNRRETIEFVVSLIENHQKIIQEINIDISEDVLDRCRIDFETDYEKDGKLLVKINKLLYIPLNNEKIKAIDISAVPICEMSDIGIDIDTERIFTDGIKTGLINVNNLDEFKYRYMLYDTVKTKIANLTKKAETAVLNGKNNPLTEQEIKIINLLDDQTSIDPDKEIHYRQELVSHTPAIPEHLIKKLKDTKPKEVSIKDFCSLIKNISKDIAN